jgi:hypothetical protein
MLAVLQADLLKIKRKWFWFLVFLGPFGVIALQIVNYGLRYDYLVNGREDVWQDLIQNVNMFVTPSLLLGMTILTSQLATIEHQQSSWKQLLSLPVKRSAVFTSKFVITLMMLSISCLLLFIGTVLLGKGLGFDSPIPVNAIVNNSFLPLLAGMPILTLQIWLAITFNNQAIPLTIGIFGSVCSMFAYYAPDWFIWKWPLLLGHHEPIWYVTAGLIVGVIFLLIGLIDFQKRDVK